ncbi:MAG: hypothetical protein GY696_30395 [Gammaproteobacteria bacterium]|nr:hypothetical protein [Gammaproteobacteria bacterium]
MVEIQVIKKQLERMQKRLSIFLNSPQLGASKGRVPTLKVIVGVLYFLRGCIPVSKWHRIVAHLILAPPGSVCAGNTICTGGSFCQYGICICPTGQTLQGTLCSRTTEFGTETEAFFFLLPHTN